MQSLIISLDNADQLKERHLAGLLSICAPPKGPEILCKVENSQ
jgi:hypothetical protein